MLYVDNFCVFPFFGLFFPANRTSAMPKVPKKFLRNSRNLLHFDMRYHYGVLKHMPVTVLVNRRGREYVDFDILVSRSGIEGERRMGQYLLNAEDWVKDKNPGWKRGWEYT